MDGKGRVAIPGRLREQLSTRANKPLILTNTDKCLDLFAWKEWEDQVEEIDGLEEHDPDLELYRAWYIGSAQEVTLDSASRILIPPSLRKEAKLGRDVVVIGMGKKIQIYDAAIWTDVGSEAKHRFTELKRKISKEKSKLAWQKADKLTVMTRDDG